MLILSCWQDLCVLEWLPWWTSQSPFSDCFLKSILPAFYDGSPCSLRWPCWAGPFKMALCSLPSHLAPASAGSRGSFSLSHCGARYPVSLIWNSAGQKWVTLLMNMHEGPRLLEKHIRLTSSFHNGGCAERSLKVPVVSKTYQLGRKVWQTPFIFRSTLPSHL